MDVILAQKMFYGQDFGWAYQLLFGITTLCMGFGLAGLARRFLVWPASMIWPSTLVNASLFYTLHNHSPSDPAETNGWRIGRYRWFLIIGIGSFVWYWFPGWIFQGLSYFTFVTWIAPENVLLNQLFGASSGYGILPITFDWSVISRLIGSPLIPPFHAIANTVAGVLVLFTALSMGIHYSRIWYGQYFPVQSATAFDNTAQSYNISMVLDENYRFVEEKYHAYSPVYLSTQYAIGFGASFASISAVIVHVALYHGRDIWRQLRFPREHESDVHMRLMRKYRDAEDWWYAALFVVMIGVSFAVCCGWPTGLPWWAFIVCIIILVIWTVPIGIVQAITNMQLSLNVLSEFVIGYMLPGRPPAMMLFKNYATYSLMQALVFAEDLKLGHYMKVPPRTMFASQLVAAIWSAIVQIAVLNWAQAVIPNACQFFGQPSNYTCPGSRFMLNASIIWGAIGPARIFSNGALYSGLQWFWLVGAVTPVITWYFARKKPKSVWRYLHMPVFFGGSGLIPPATVYHYL